MIYYNTLLFLLRNIIANTVETHIFLSFHLAPNEGF